MTSYGKGGTTPLSGVRLWTWACGVLVSWYLAILVSSYLPRDIVLVVDVSGCIGSWLPLTLLPLLPNSVMPWSPMLSPCHCYLLPGGLAYPPIPKMISIGEILEYFQGPHTPDAACLLGLCTTLTYSLSLTFLKLTCGMVNAVVSG